MLDVIHQSEFRDARASHSFDSFKGTSKERVAAKYGVRGVNFTAYK